MIKRREFLIGATLLVTGSTNLLLQSPAKPEPVFSGNIDDMIPAEFEGWVASGTSTAILPPNDELERAIYDQVVVRQFEQRGHAPITLMIAHTPPQSYSTQLHLPDLCYQASNFRIESLERETMRFSDKSIPISVMQASRGRRHDKVLYWARFGDAYPQSLWEQRFQIAKQALAGEKHDGFLLRLSVTERGERANLNTLTDFATAFMNAIPRQLREQLF